MTTFKIQRADGRSNAEVVLDYLKDKPAGTVFTYKELAAELSKGSNHTYAAKEVQSLATKLYPRLLKEQARALHNVRNIGYRLAPAAFHVTLANGRQSKADRQMLRGVQTLQHVRWDEMDANQKQAHEGQLLITGAMYQQMKALERRQDVIESAIRKMRNPQSADEAPAITE